MQQAGDEKRCARLWTVLVMHTLPHHSCFVLKATAAGLTQSVHSFFCSHVLLNAAACALPQPQLLCTLLPLFKCWQENVVLRKAPGVVLGAAELCVTRLCFGCPKCFPEAGAKQGINLCQLMPLPGNIRALICLGKLGEWQ